jgi:GMP synthase-like glutamine amidotransferase
VLVIEHQSEAGVGYLGEQLEGCGVELVQVGPDVGAPVPASLDGFDGLIVLGGSMGPTDDDEAPWLPATRRLLADAVAQRLPTLGICLGAQLLATATGGRVSPMPNGPEVGLQAVRLLEAAADDPLLGGTDGAELPVVQWHWLEAEELPEGASLLASSPACANQAYRVGERAWGLQFHPEALGDSARDWAALDDLTAHGFDPERVVREVREAEPRLRQTWRLLADRFAALVTGG